MRYLLAIFFMLVPFGAALADSDTSAKVQQSEVRRGRLPNGLQYIIARAPDHGGKVAVHLGVLAGFRDEGPTEVQVAHLLEHVLAFSYFDASGAPIHRANPTADGRNELLITANTGGISTKYTILSPATDLDLALSWARQIAQDSPFRDEHVIEQAGPVIAEKLSNSDWTEEAVVARALAQRWGTALAGDIIGSMRRADGAEVRRFYAKFYRAERETLVVVGDVDPAAVERQIALRFGTIRGDGAVHASAAEAPQQFKALYAPSPFARRMSFSLIFGSDPTDEPDAVEARQRAVRAIIAQILQKRFAAASRRYGYPLAEVVVNGQESIPGVFWPPARQKGLEIRASTTPREFGDAIEETGELIARTLDGDAWAGDVEKAKAALRPSFDRSVRVPSLLELVEAFGSGMEEAVMDKPVAPLSLNAFDAINPGEILVEARRLFSAGPVRYVGTGPSSARPPEDLRMMARLFEKGMNGRPRQSEAVPAFSSTVSAKLKPRTPLVRNMGDGAIEIVLAQNGLRMVLRASDEAPKLIIANSRGLSLVSDDMLPLIPATEQLAELGDFGGLDFYEREDFFAQAGMSANFRIGQNSLIEVAAPAARVETLFSVSREFLLGPHVGGKATSEMSRLRTLGLARRDDFRVIVERALSIGVLDHRAAVEKIPTARDVKRLWQNQFGSFDTMTFTLEGRITKDEAVRFAAQYFGDLPSVRSNSPVAGRSSIAPGRYAIRAEESGSVPAVVHVSFLSKPLNDAHADSILGAFSDIWNKRMFDRLRTRERAAYSPTGFAMATPDAREARIAVNFTSLPKDADRLIEASWDELASINTKGLTAAERDLFLSTLAASDHGGCDEATRLRQPAGAISCADRPRDHIADLMALLAGFNRSKARIFVLSD